MEESIIELEKVIPVNFSSILSVNNNRVGQEQIPDEPACFIDLNLDQIIHGVTAGKQLYNLKPFFYSPPQNVEDMQYRQDVFRDLENETLIDQLNSFSGDMIAMRRYLGLSKKLEFRHHIMGWRLEALLVYSALVSRLAKDLMKADLHSHGLQAFRDYVTQYASSDEFTAMQAWALQLKTELVSVKYCVQIKGNWVRVRKYEGETDYSDEVEKTFEKFKQGAVKDYLSQLELAAGMSRVGAQILGCVAKLYPEIFRSLEEFDRRYPSFLDETIQVFDREIQFYIAYLEYIGKIKKAGFSFCYPAISAQSKEIYDYGGFDLALANIKIKEHTTVVCNDFYLKGQERIIVVSGPNQGGKTTFARMFGQLHYLANLGCPVPGREAQLYAFDQIFTHFEKEENIKNLRGKLKDELVRFHNILDRATPDSILIMNEIFTSTTLKDAIFLSKQVLDKIIRLDLLCVCVTFIDELSSLSEKTVSMVSTVVPENPELRTFKIVRRPADGLSYALSIAEKYRVTYDAIKERIQ